MSGLSSSDLNVIINVLKSYPTIDEAILFGSRAKGTHKPGSDVDIAIRGPGTESITARLSGQLNDETPLPYTFDVVSLDTLENQALREHIERVGVLLYKSGQKK